MKRTKTTLFSAALGLAAILPSHAAILLTDDFNDIPDGDLTADADWVAFSGADMSIDVTSGVVTGLGSDAEDVATAIPETSGVYFGLDVNVSDDASEGYVMGFQDGGALAARFFFAGDGTSISVGVNSGGTGGGTAGATSTGTFALNSNTRIVGFADGTGTVSAWINPSIGDLGTPDATISNADVGGLDGFFFRQGGTWDNGGAAWTADNLIVATTFAEVFPIPEPSSIALLGFGLAALVRRQR